MLALTTGILELRGVITKTSQKGTSYYILNTEDFLNGEPYQFFVRKFELIPPNLKKGDLIKIVVHYNRFKELEVIEISRAE